MTKEEFKNSISLYMDGDLSSDKMNEFEEILDNDKELQIYYNQIAGIVNNLNKIEKVKVSDDFMDVLHEKINKQNNNPISNPGIPSEVILEGASNATGFKMFGFDPIPALGMAAAVILSFQIFSSYKTANLPTLSSEESIDLNVIDTSIDTEIAFGDSLNQIDQNPEERKKNNMSTQKASFED